MSADYKYIGIGSGRRIKFLFEANEVQSSGNALPPLTKSEKCKIYGCANAALGRQ